MRRELSETLDASGAIDDAYAIDTIGEVGDGRPGLRFTAGEEREAVEDEGIGPCAAVARATIVHELKDIVPVFAVQRNGPGVGSHIVVAAQRPYASILRAATDNAVVALGKLAPLRGRVLGTGRQHADDQCDRVACRKTSVAGGDADAVVAKRTRTHGPGQMAICKAQPGRQGRAIGHACRIGKRIAIGIAEGARRYRHIERRAADGGDIPKWLQQHRGVIFPAGGIERQAEDIRDGQAAVTCDDLDVDRGVACRRRTGEARAVEGEPGGQGISASEPRGERQRIAIDIGEAAKGQGHIDRIGA